jgi:hypothetical protein
MVRLIRNSAGTEPRCETAVPVEGSLEQMSQMDKAACSVNTLASQHQLQEQGVLIDQVGEVLESRPK